MWLKNNQKELVYAPGCNANAVAEYILFCLSALKKLNLLKIKRPMRAGIIGIGQVGSSVIDKLKILGFEIICHDPPRSIREPNFKSVSLDLFATSI